LEVIALSFKLPLGCVKPDFAISLRTTSTTFWS
jgi:hypothetical protein